mmetsp:Transcript_29225/g.28295  ORF Transcript_29225/g.28295 Transcript_29225/m.28295 type:complete len:129 (-) Transcript_29225:5728-6114(-)
MKSEFDVSEASPERGLFNFESPDVTKKDSVLLNKSNLIPKLSFSKSEGLNDPQNFDFQNPFEFLDGIKTKIDFENDLKFYQYQDANSNSSYGVTSLIIRNNDLIDQFGGNKGKLQFFKDGCKFCDLSI